MISEVYQTIGNIYITKLWTETLKWQLMAAKPFHILKSYLCTRHTMVTFNKKNWDDLWSGLALRKGLKTFRKKLWNNTCAGVLFFLKLTTGLNKVTNSLGIYIIKHCLFFQRALLLTLLKFCLFLDIVKPFFPVVVPIFSIRVICLFNILKKMFKLWYDKNLLKRN